MSADNRRRQPSPIVLYLIHDDAIFNVDCRSCSFINTNVDTSTLSQVASSLPHEHNNPQPTLIGHESRSSCATSNDLPTAEVISAATRACVDPGLASPSLCWLIVWVGEDCWCCHVICGLYYASGGERAFD